MGRSATTIKKGEVRNNTGKPKGAISVKTQQWKALGDYITQVGAERYMKELMALPGNEFLLRFEAVLNYFKPRLSASSITGKDGEALFPIPIVDVSKNNSNKQSDVIIEAVEGGARGNLGQQNSVHINLLDSVSAVGLPKGDADINSGGVISSSSQRSDERFLDDNEGT